MATIQDAEYVKLCARLASARREVDQAAAKEGNRDIASRRAKAEELLAALDNDSNNKSETLDALLSTSEGNVNFMLED